MKVVNLGLLLLGVGLLVVLLLQFDPRAVWLRIQPLGWSFLLVLALFTLGLLVSTCAWQQVIDPALSRASYLQLLGAFWAGFAINSLTPTASLGEVYRATRLRGRVEGEEIVASLITYNFIGACTVQLFTLLGPLVCLLWLDLPPRVMAALLGLSLLFFIPPGLFWLAIRLGATQLLMRILIRLRLLRSRDPEAWLEKARSVDERVRCFRRKQPARFFGAAGWLVSARVLQVVEVWTILLALMPDRRWTWLLMLALLHQTTNQLLSWALSIVPGRVGVMEGGAALLFRLLGLDPALGFSVELIRRARGLIAIAVGLLIGLGDQIRRRGEPAKGKGSPGSGPPPVASA